MNSSTKVDAFTYHILNNIDIKVLESLSSIQLSAFKEALRTSQSKKKHSIDIRGVIKLFFAGYYFVLLMGRDRRITTQDKEFERRTNIALMGNIFFIIFVLSPFILLILIALYFFKTGMGIDLFPGKHMGWIFGL